jgi:succinoglycan biosynthesis protein ExoA
MNKGEGVDVSVVVPCRNEIRHIRRFLNSVSMPETSGMSVEVLIADGMSEDGTRQVLDQYLHQSLDRDIDRCESEYEGSDDRYPPEPDEKLPAFFIIDNFKKIASSGLNAAIRAARGEIIVRMDVHTEYAPDYVRNCVEILNRTSADNVGGPALTRADGYLARAIALGFHSRFACGGARFRDARYEGYVDTVPYGCWRKSTLEALGLFDETLVRSQDDELNVRIAASGGKIWQSLKITSWYRPRTTLSGLFRQYFQYGFWKVSVIRKHRRPASWRNLVPGVSLLAAIALLFGAVVATLSGLVHWRNAFLCDWSALASLYFAASLFASVLSARKCGWKFLPILPIVFATYHLSYGLGSLLGIVYHPSSRLHLTSVQKALTAITN